MRAQIERKKAKVFRQQRHHAKAAMIEDAERPLEQHEYESRVDLRKMRLDALVEKGRATQEMVSILAQSNVAPPRGPGAEARPVEAGQAVEARRRRGDFWLPARVTGVDKRASVYDLLYADGEVERRVERQYVGHRFEIEALVECLPTPPPGKEAVSRMDERWVSGKVIGKHDGLSGERTYDVRFDDGGEETHIGADRCRPKPARPLGVDVSGLEDILAEKCVCII
jgi:hypothetical protein